MARNTNGLAGQEQSVTGTALSIGPPGEIENDGARRLAELEKIIEARLFGLLEIGQALLEVQEQGLHKHSEHGDGTVEGYFHARWGLDRQAAYRLIHWARGQQILYPFGHTIPNEAVARALSPLLPEPHLYREAYEGALQEAKDRRIPLTAKLVSDAVKFVRLGKGEDADQEGDDSDSESDHNETEGEPGQDKNGEQSSEEQDEGEDDLDEGRLYEEALNLGAAFVVKLDLIGEERLLRLAIEFDDLEAAGELLPEHIRALDAFCAARLGNASNEGAS